MKKILTTMVSLLVVLVLPAVVFAQGKNNQVQYQNQGEEQQVQVTTQEQEGLWEEQDEESQSQTAGQPKSIAPRSETARERMSVVAQAVEELLTTQGAKGGIGEQISQVAREQKLAQQEIEEGVENLETRPDWLEKIIGPDYRAVGSLRQQIEQNRMRIQQLEQLQNQLINQADQNQVQEAIQAMVGQNTALEEHVGAKEKVGSVFGWLFRLFVK